MASSSWILTMRHRTGRTYSSQTSEDSRVHLDVSRGLHENVKEVLTNLCQRHNVTNMEKLAYLNAIVRLISENDSPDYGLSAEDLFCCLRVGLVHEATQVRAAAFRAVRYMLKKEQDVIAINKLQYPYLVARSMDLNLPIGLERMEALRVVRRILVLAPKHFSPVLARSIVSMVNGGAETIREDESREDSAFRAFLAALCELGVLNSNLLISCGGVVALARAAMTGQSSTVIESVIGVLLNLLNTPDTRNSVSLLCFAAPYCELDSSSIGRSKGDKEKFSASKLALLSIMRSYAGLLHFCRPDDNSGLKAIADILYVEQLEVRGAVLELLYELLDLPLPTWTDEPDVALAAVDPSRARDSWVLSEGFVAAEGKFILPTLSSHCPNITEIHLALLVYALLECGLHRALAETIVSTDTFISVRAAVLLGALLHLAHSLLPSEVCDLTPPLPNLLEHASAGKHQALAAVTILERMHTMMRRRPSPASLFLDRILQAGTWLRPTLPRRQRTSNRNWLRRDSPTSSLLKHTQVLSSEDALAWNWPVIRSILRSREDTIRILHDSDHRLFIKRLVRYFKPLSNEYSVVKLATSLAREATLAGCDLLNCLLELHEPESMKLLNKLIGDIADQISSIRTASSAHDCFFSPGQMSTTCCQKYFLFLGQLSHSAKGTVILNGFDLLKKLQDLAVTTRCDCYIKLIVSSLDYSRDGPNRKVMAKITTEASLDSGRLYATQFLRLILRARMTDASRWAIILLLNQLSDPSKTVALSALEALHEACEESEYLEAIFQESQSRDWDKWLDHLGDKGYLLKVRLFSLRQGFSAISSPAEELEKWIRPGGYGETYVDLIEGDIHDALTRRQRDEAGCYPRRTSSALVTPHNVFVLPHLIGQMVQHDLGIQLLVRRNVIQRFARVIQRFRAEFDNKDCESNTRYRSNKPITDDTYIMSEESGTDETVESNRLETILDSEVVESAETHCPQKTGSLIEIRRKISLDDSIRTTPEKSWRVESETCEEQYVSLPGRLLKIKSALWALGHMGTSAAGVEQLNQLGIIELLTSVAETCSFYVLRATAMYGLSLIATTRSGADALTNFDWPCVRRRRGDHWPVVPPAYRYTAPSPIPVPRHHRSLSDGKSEISEPVGRRTRNRSESAATDLETRRYILPERGETPSPVSSIQRLSQQDGDGYAKLRSLQRHRRPSYSQSSLEMYSLDGRLSLQSLSEFDSSRSWIAENVLTPTPPPSEDVNDNLFYIGISLPRRLVTIFPDSPQMSLPPAITEEVHKPEGESTEADEESCSEYDVDTNHYRICLVCPYSKSTTKDSIPDQTIKTRRKILSCAQRLANPVWYRHSRQTLLRLKQRHPEIFQDTCFFSDVAARLGSGTYRMGARRFLQELFLDCSFETLYVEPTNILKLNAAGEGNSSKSVPSAVDSHAELPTDRKINGRLTCSEMQVAKLASVAEEATGDTQPTYQCNKPQEAPRKVERKSDEKIIAEILNPEERLRTSKSSDRLLKVSGTNTAVNLD